ncbi:MAG: trehalose-phosphatase [Hyphomonadaceae bacterium]
MSLPIRQNAPGADALIDVPRFLRERALFLDFDGTLAALQDDPETVRLPVGGADILATLHDRLAGRLTILSGRDMRDLSRRIPHTLRRIGGHGLEVCRPGEAPGVMTETPPPDLAHALDRLSAGEPGTRVEPKGPILALHYRFAPERGDALLHALRTIAADFPAYRIQSGKLVLEVKPARANKGVALTRQMSEPEFASFTPVMIGDDATDEDAISAATDLGGFGVKVGDGDSRAKLRLKDPAEVWAWLETLATHR